MTMQHDPLLEPDAVRCWQDYCVLDARTADAFALAHLAGAVNVPVLAWERHARTDDTNLHQVAYWQREIGALGIDGQRPVLVHDDGRMIDAARVWFILQYFGVDVRVLNGGWVALHDKSTLRFESGTPTLSTAMFPARPGSGPAALADRDEVLAALGSATQVLDVRSEDEFNGVDRRNHARAGHLPDAVLMPHRVVLDADGRVRRADELAALFHQRGFGQTALITHCDGGGRAALAALAAVRAGLGDVAVYYLSFADWASQPACPIKKGGR